MAATFGVNVSGGRRRNFLELFFLSLRIGKHLIAMLILTSVLFFLLISCICFPFSLGREQPWQQAGLLAWCGRGWPRMRRPKPR